MEATTEVLRAVFCRCQLVVKLGGCNSLQKFTDTESCVKTLAKSLTTWRRRHHGHEILYVSERTLLPMFLTKFLSIAASQERHETSCS